MNQMRKTATEMYKFKYNTKNFAKYKISERCTTRGLKKINDSQWDFDIILFYIDGPSVDEKFITFEYYQCGRLFLVKKKYLRW